MLTSVQLMQLELYRLTLKVYLDNSSHNQYYNYTVHLQSNEFK